MRAGVIASRIAAHAADTALGRPGARDADDDMARARQELDWDRQAELAIDPATVCAWRRARMDADQALGDLDTCSMCGEYCAVKISRDVFGPG